MRHCPNRIVLAVIVLIAIPALGAAQGTIAGVVRDSSGAVLPGVTVEAASDALIERSRQAVTDSAGQYKIIDLRPGAYTVTFTLSGFNTVRREGLVLSGPVTLPVNADLAVGSLQETVTVTGESPVIDTQSTRQQFVLRNDLLENIPRAHSAWATGAMLPGVVGGRGDVGGSIGDQGMPSLAIHGGTVNDFITAVDGIQQSEYSAVGTGERNVAIVSDLATQEVVFDTSALSAESAVGGVRINIVPREGGNRFTPSFFANYAGEGMTSDNLSDRITSRGLRSTNKLIRIWDVSGALGGPVKRDRLWFFTSARNWGAENRVADSFFETNPTRQATDPQHYWSMDLRLTWQATARNKISAYTNWLDRDVAYWQVAATRTPEASLHQNYPQLDTTIVRWSSPLTSRVLVEAASHLHRVIEDFAQPAAETRPGSYPVVEITTGRNSGRYAPLITVPHYDRSRQASVQSSVSYVTGSHALKVGFTHYWASKNVKRPEWLPTLRLNNGAPFQVQLFARPHVVLPRINHDLGVYVQDQWTRGRLTLTPGLRFDYLNVQIDAQDAPAGQFIPARHFDRVRNVPNWKDVSPRLGAAYDLFGNGKTALKASANRYLSQVGVQFANSVNPMFAGLGATDTRTWADRNGDFVPQLDELGPSTNLNFGKPVFPVLPEPGLNEGWGKRGDNWEFTASVQHEMVAGLSASVGYFRRVYGNLLWTDNTAVELTDYTPFVITSPLNNEQITLYNLRPEKRGLNDNLRRLAPDNEEVFDGVDLLFNGKFGRGGLATGGISMGRTRTHTCTVDDPNQLRFCDVSPPFMAENQYKFIVAHPLPWALHASASFTSTVGPRIAANYTVTPAIAGIPLTLGAVTVNLVEPGRRYTERLNQLNLRFARTFSTGPGRVQGIFEVFNVTNANTILTENLTYGPAWLRPTSILPGRLVKIGAQVNF